MTIAAGLKIVEARQEDIPFIGLVVMIAARSHTDGWLFAERLKAIALCRSERVPGAWIVESVAARPEFRKQGLTNALLEAILDAGRDKGASTAEISVLIGNDRAQLAYEKAGFVVVDERRHAEHQRVIGCPGVRLLRRTI